MHPRRLALAALSGTVVLAGGIAAGLLSFQSPHSEPAELSPAPIIEALPPGFASVEPIEPPRIDATPEAADPPETAIVEAALHEVHPTPPESPALQLSVPSTPRPTLGYGQDADDPLDSADECLLPQICIDQYLWAVYQRAPKVDTIRVPTKIKVTIKKKGKTKTVTKTVVKLVDEDFTWKDPKAAKRAGMSMPDYVIGGMDPRFKLKLYRALRAMEAAGLAPGITSGFRDDYRQSLASGNNAATDSSYHGGSRRGGYGHGLAADLVSVKGDTRVERWKSSEALWKWIDAHEKELGVGRPYLDRDPPHVGPIDGKEYADKRGRPSSVHAAFQPKPPHRAAVHQAAAGRNLQKRHRRGETI